MSDDAQLGDEKVNKKVNFIEAHDIIIITRREPKYIIFLLALNDITSRLIKWRQSLY